MTVGDKKDIAEWIGWMRFAGFMMILVGALEIIWGVIVLSGSNWLVVGDKGLLLFNLTAWGWIQLILGLVILSAGFLMMNNAPWRARTAGMVVAVVSVLSNALLIDIHPIWSTLIIIADVFIIYALTVHAVKTK